MQTNMKNNWADQILEAANAPYTKLMKISALWIDRRKIVLGDKICFFHGEILPTDATPTHKVIGLEGTLSDNKHRLTLENISTNQIETIDL